MILIFAGPQFLSPKKEDPWTLVRRLEARLAQEKFYHEKTKTESQYEVKVNAGRSIGACFCWTVSWTTLRFIFSFKICLIVDRAL